MEMQAARISSGRPNRGHRGGPGPLVAAVLVVLLSGGGVSWARAEESARGPTSAVSTSKLTFSAALAAAAQRGPLVLEAAHNHEAARAFAQEPGSSLPALPQLTVLAGARRPYNLPTGPEVVLSVQQEIATGKLGEARKKAAEWSARATGSELSRARLEGVTTAALAWVSLREAQDLAALRNQAHTDAERLLQIADARVKGGAATSTERSLAEAEVGSARLAELDAEGRETEARLILAPLESRWIAEGVAEVPGVEAGETPGPFLVDPRGPQTGSHPALRAAEAHAERLAHEGTVNRVMLGPMLSVGGSIWREGSGDRAAAAVVTVPLPFFDPARYETQKQSLAVFAARAQTTRLRGELEREARLAAHDQEHTREVVTQLQTGVLDPLRRAVATSTIAYEAGTMELGLVLLARRSALAAAERLVSAKAEVSRADVRAAALSGALWPKESR
jgi:outer membrane protein TolC